MDYQGRSFLHAPQDVGVNLRSDSPPDRCFLPKSQIHTWEGHTKGISQIKWFPRTAHLLLSCSMDCRVKVDHSHCYSKIQSQNVLHSVGSYGKFIKTEDVLELIMATAKQSETLALIMMAKDFFRQVMTGTLNYGIQKLVLV